MARNLIFNYIVAFVESCHKKRFEVNECGPFAWHSQQFSTLGSCLRFAALLILTSLRQMCKRSLPTLAGNLVCAFTTWKYLLYRKQYASCYNIYIYVSLDTCSDRSCAGDIAIATVFDFKDWQTPWVSSSRRPISSGTTWKIMCLVFFFFCNGEPSETFHVETRSTDEPFGLNLFGGAMPAAMTWVSLLYPPHTEQDRKTE